MFRLDKDFTEDDLSKVTDQLDRNYELRPGDALLLDVFTNGGERLIDPNMEMMQDAGMAGQQGQMFRDRFTYIVQVDGLVTFPMIGDMKVEGMTLFEAERAIASKFTEYKDTFVKLRITNRRVFVLGAPGGQVVPLPNENTDLVEVLASAQGLEMGAKAQNIKVIRGQNVYRIDLSTITGMMETNMQVEPGDIVYVEPWRRPWLETLRDVSPALSLLTSALTLIVVVQNL